VVANLEEESWQLKAACRGPQSTAFFPPARIERRDERISREAEAKSICRSCVVRQPCLEYALRIREQHGIWGGLNEQERRVLVDAHGD
jgi:WhiB family transcriptional regulator, redox-sensing transcriptional regulator